MSPSFKNLVCSSLIAFAASVGIAEAGIYTGTYAITAVEGLTYGWGFNAQNTNPFASYAAGSTANATFSYTGALNFSNTNYSAPDTNTAFGYTAGNVSNYSGSGTVTYNSTTVANSTSLSSFLSSTASASGEPYGSWYSIDLGIISAGTVLTITHDDGASIYQNGLYLGQTVYGPTAEVTDTVRLSATADTMLYYTRQNGAPSVLQVSVPEPSSITVLIAGLTGIAFVRRRRNCATL